MNQGKVLYTVFTTFSPLACLFVLRKFVSENGAHSRRAFKSARNLVGSWNGPDVDRVLIISVLLRWL